MPRLLLPISSSLAAAAIKRSGQRIFPVTSSSVPPFKLHHTDSQNQGKDDKEQRKAQENCDCEVSTVNPFFQGRVRSRSSTLFQSPSRKFSWRSGAGNGKGNGENESLMRSLAQSSLHVPSRSVKTLVIPPEDEKAEVRCRI